MTDYTASLRRGLVWGSIAFGAVLAVVIGVRLQQAALAVIVGLACGVGASIPASLLIVTLFNRNRRRHGEQGQQPAGHAPPLVVVAPPGVRQPRKLGTWPEEYTLPSPRQRRFSIIGDEEITELD
jgi:hypothetical protein